MPGNIPDAKYTALLDQNWMHAEEFAMEFERIAITPNMPLLIVCDPNAERLIRKACAIVATQALLNIKSRKSEEQE